MKRSAPGRPWHVSADDAQAYATGRLPEPACWSLEKHLEQCSACALRVSDAVRAGSAAVARSLDAGRADLLAAIGAAAPAAAPAPVANPASAEHPGRAEARRNPVQGWGAWLTWAAGPTLGLSWLLSLTLVMAVAVVLARTADAAQIRPLLLSVAPLLPVAGVAVSYGRHADPLYEMVAATPSAGLRLLLVRTALVLAVCVPLLTAAGWLMPAQDGSPGPAAWLLPGLAMTLLTLVIGSGIGCLRASAVSSTVWLLLLTVDAATGPGVTGLIGRFDQAFAHLSSGPAQGVWAAASLLCGGLLALRRASFDQLERL